MLKRLSATLIAITFCPLLRGAQQIAHPQPITSDFSHGATFQFKIAPDLPEFTFKVIPDVQGSDEYGNPRTTVREVQVFRGDSKQPIQNLEDCEFADMEPPPRNSDWFRAEDMNFDSSSSSNPTTLRICVGIQRTPVLKRPHTGVRPRQLSCSMFVRRLRPSGADCSVPPQLGASRLCRVRLVVRAAGKVRRRGL